MMLQHHKIRGCGFMNLFFKKLYNLKKLFFIIASILIVSCLETTLTVSVTSPKYIGIKNSGSTCTLDASLQLLYHDQAFKKLILELKDLNKAQTPYLSALKEQFTRMDNSTDRSVSLSFTRPQQQFLIATYGYCFFGMSGFEWAETRLLSKCIYECQISGRNATANEIIKIMCFDARDDSIFDGTGEKRLSAVLNSKGKELLNKSIKDKIESCSYLPNTINLLCIDSSKKYNELYNFNDVTETANKIELSNGKVLELQGVAMHTGTHCYAIVKNPESDNWVRLDDSTVIQLGKDAKDKNKSLQLIYRQAG